MFSSAPLARLDDQAERGALLLADLDLGERWDADGIDAVLGQVVARDGDGLDGLVDRARANCLDLGAPMLPNDASDGAGDSRCP